MNRRQFVTSSSLGIAGLALAVRVWAQAPAAQAPPVTKFEELRRGVGFHRQRRDDRLSRQRRRRVAIDSQFMNTAEICVAGLKQRAPKGIELLINTHHHGDHTGGNKAVSSPS